MNNGNQRAMRASALSVGTLAILVAVLVSVWPKKPCACGHPSSEAIDQIDRIFKASATYFGAPHVDSATGERLPCQFPRSIGLTPSASPGCCGDDGRGVDGRCVPRPSEWEAATWTALDFRMTDLHRFHFQYESSGVGADAKFTVSAYADIDCDGVWSTFERYGYADTTSEGTCAMKESSAFFKVNESE